MTKCLKALLAAMASFVLIASVATVQAADDDAPSGRVTFYKDVLPVMQENCQTCHRPNGANLGGMVAPMAFVTYQETRPWAKSIAKSVQTRLMPPWHADSQHHGVFENERTMTKEDIAVLVRWSMSGAVAGNRADAPEPLVWPSAEGWTIGEPDLIVKMPEPYFMKDDIEDIYVNLRTEITKEMLPEDRWIKAVEFRPGSSIVHHIIARPLGGIAPGNDPTIHRNDVGALMRAGSTVTWQMHYHKEAGPGTGAWDQSSVAVKFYPKGYEVKYPLKGDSLGDFSFRIPAGEPNHVVTKDYTFDQDARIITFMPHMHLRGKAAKYEVTYPDGSHEVLLDIPVYDFNWQTSYNFKIPKFVPKGTKLTLTTVFDNSANNPYNPDPTKEVRWGQPTTAEMSFGWMSFIDPEKGTQ